MRIIFKIVAITGMICLLTLSPCPAQEQEPSEQSITASVQNLVDAGIIKKIDVEQNRIYVNSDQWNNVMDIDTKQTLGYVVAVYFNYQKAGRWVEIYDYISGEKLAKYGSMGFKIY